MSFLIAMQHKCNTYHTCKAHTRGLKRRKGIGRCCCGGTRRRTWSHGLHQWLLDIMEHLGEKVHATRHGLNIAQYTVLLAQHFLHQCRVAHGSRPDNERRKSEWLVLLCVRVGGWMCVCGCVCVCRTSDGMSLGLQTMRAARGFGA